MRMFVLMSCFVFFFVEPAAARALKCGEMQISSIRDVFDGANIIKNFQDVRKNLRRACDMMQEFEEWEEDVSETGAHHNEDYIKGRDTSLRGITYNITYMKIPLTTIRNWLDTNPGKKVLVPEKVEKARSQLINYEKALNRHTRGLKDVMKGKYEDIVHPSDH